MLVTYGIAFLLVVYGLTWVVLRVTRDVSAPMVTTTSTAMRPEIRPGDLVLLHDTSPGDVDEGDVVAYDGGGEDVSFGRVQALDQRGTFFEYVVGGDNRPREDDVTITDDDVVGRVDRRFPIVGYGLVVVRSPAGQLLVAASTAFGVAATYRARFDRRRRRLEAAAVPDEPRALPYGGEHRAEPGPPMGNAMSITPAELRHVRFAQVRKGYDTEAVDRALESVADSIEDLLHERHELHERIRGLEAEIERYREVEATLSQTLTLAERAAEELKAEAQAEADRLLAEARAAVATAQQQAASTAASAPAPTAAPTSSMPDPAFIELLGETRAIRSLLQAVLTQSQNGGGSPFQPRT